MNDDTKLDEQRKTERRRVRQPAQIGESSVVDCEIQSISEAGALIAVRSSEYIPNLFKLRIIGSEDCLIARVKWRRALSVGVCFE